MQQYDLKMLPVSEIACPLMHSFSHTFHALFSKLILYSADDLQKSLNKLRYYPMAQQTDVNNHKYKFP